jgi:ferredoxin
MKVKLDRPSCVGHAQCYAVSPDLFPLTTMGTPRSTTMTSPLPTRLSSAKASPGAQRRP